MGNRHAVYKYESRRGIKAGEVFLPIILFALTMFVGIGVRFESIAFSNGVLIIGGLLIFADIISLIFSVHARSNQYIFICDDGIYGVALASNYSRVKFDIDYDAIMNIKRIDRGLQIISRLGQYKLVNFYNNDEVIAAISKCYPGVVVG